MGRVTGRRAFLRTAGVVAAGIGVAAAGAGARGGLAAGKTGSTTYLPLVARPPVDLALAGQIGGTTEAIVRQGTRAYLGLGPRLLVLDLGDPHTPRELGRSAPMLGVVLGLAAAGDLLYVAAGRGGLRIYNVATGAALAEVGHVETPGQAQAVSVVGSYAYLAEASVVSGGVAVGGGLRVVDVADPAHPRLVGFYDSPGSGLWSTPAAYPRAVAAAGRYAYLADGDAGLRVVDVGDPADPREVGAYSPGAQGYSLVLQGQYVYLSHWNAGVSIVDVSDPTAPVQVGYYNAARYIWSLAVDGRYLYLGDREYSEVRILDVSNPQAPTLAGIYACPEPPKAVAASGTSACIARDGGLWVVDAANPASPATIGSFGTTGGQVMALDVLGGRAYVCMGRRLVVVDLVDPTNLKALGSVGDYQSTLDVGVAGRYAYLAAGYFRVVDVADPAKPTEVGSTGQQASALEVSGRYAYTTIGNLLTVWDLVNPASPVQVGQCSGLISAQGMVVAGGRAYVADGGTTGSLRVFDVSDPASPHLVRFSPTARAQGVAVSGTHAYLAAGDDGLRVFEGLASDDLTQVALVPTRGSATAVAVDGRHAYVLDSVAGLSVLDVADPARPFLAGRSPLAGDGLAVAASGGWIYVSDGRGGLAVLRDTVPTGP